MVDPFLKAPDYQGSYHFFEGFHGLTEEGIPGDIQKRYEDVVSRASWFTYNGMWNASGKGIIKGMLVTTALVAVGAALVGIMGGHIEGMSSAGSIIEGIGNGLDYVIKNTTLATALPVLATGAAFGGVYEVHKHRDVIQTELLKTREMIREHQGVQRDKQKGVEQAHVIHDFDPMGEVSNQAGLGHWKARVEARKQGAALLHPVSDSNALIDAEKARIRQQQQAMADEGAQRQQEVAGWIAKEELRRQQRMQGAAKGLTENQI